MYKDESTPLFLFILIAILSLVIFLIGEDHGKDKMKEKAVQAGVAEWGHDEKGKAKFEFIISAAPKIAAEKTCTE